MSLTTLNSRTLTEKRVQEIAACYSYVPGDMVSGVVQLYLGKVWATFIAGKVTVSLQQSNLRDT